MGYGPFGNRTAITGLYRATGKALRCNGQSGSDRLGQILQQRQGGGKGQRDRDDLGTIAPDVKDRAWPDCHQRHAAFPAGTRTRGFAGITGSSSCTSHLRITSLSCKVSGMGKICQIDNCRKPAKTAGHCLAHYKRLLKHGNALAGGTAKGAVIGWLQSHVSFQSDECLPFPFNSGANGRGVMQFKGQLTRPARAMCTMAHGAPAEGQVVAHLCGNGHKGCVNPRHLRWSSQIENEADKIVHGTSNRGAQNGMSKLSEASVLQILSMKNTASARETASTFKVSASLISAIWRGERWRHVSVPEP